MGKWANGAKKSSGCQELEGNQLGESQDPRRRRFDQTQLPSRIPFGLNRLWICQICFIATQNIGWVGGGLAASQRLLLPSHLCVSHRLCQLLVLSKKEHSSRFARLLVRKIVDAFRMQVEPERFFNHSVRLKLCCPKC